MSISSKPDFYFDLQQFSQLKLQAKTDEAKSIEAASKQFEGLFVQQMLKAMRDAARIDESQHSHSIDFYTDMYDKQLSVMLAENGGMGIAKMMMQQLGVEPADVAKTGKTLAEYQLREYGGQRNIVTGLDAYRAENPAVRLGRVIETDVIETDNTADDFTADLAMPAPVADGPAQAQPLADVADKVTMDRAETTNHLQSETIEAHFGWPRREDYIADILPHAREAAARLGVSAEVLVAQSALETGWGRHAMKKPDGSLALNLFGIKADSRWQGESVEVNTHEFRHGRMQSELASFRSYETLAEGFADYADFIRSSERYQDAMQHNGDDATYVRGLQAAGYATDPRYADKILSILQRGEFRQTVAALESAESRLS